MTFEDFKNHFEKFSKIDTAEKLAICESQYEQHRLHMEDENFFEPTGDNQCDDIVSRYTMNLNRIFRIEAITENQIYFLVIPSFEPEQLLTLEKRQDSCLLKLTILTKNYWTVFYANNKIIDVEKRVVTSSLNPAIAEKLFKLLNKAIFEARQPKAGRIVLDGVIYRLFAHLNGEQKIVSKHSQSENSKSGQLIDIMQQLIDNIENLDEKVLLKIDTKITSMEAWYTL